MLLHFVAVCVSVYLSVCVNLSAICLVCGLCGGIYIIFCIKRACVCLWGKGRQQRAVEGRGVSWVRNSVLRKCACGDTQFQFMNVNIYVLISNNATSEILMKYKQNVSAPHATNTIARQDTHTHTQTSRHTHTERERESSAHAGKHRHS